MLKDRRKWCRKCAKESTQLAISREELEISRVLIRHSTFSFFILTVLIKELRKSQGIANMEKQENHVPTSRLQTGVTKVQQIPGQSNVF